MIWLRKLAIGSSLLALALASAFYWETRDLPGTEEIHDKFRDHTAPFGGKNWVPLSAIAPQLREAVVAGEDGSFYGHHGFDYDGLRAAFLEDLRTREFRRGGSTITQQVAKNVFLNPEKTLQRKFREAILTWRIERALSKDQILEVYLNVVDWGDGIAGAGSASHFYFSKAPRELTWSEAALLAAMLANPRRLNPVKAPSEALHLRNLLLLKLLVEQDMTPGEYQEASHSPLQ
ncbi:MAG TPA: biosynthetic peptidoglycan transglycosylase [Candidatus Acidoferrum sp.]|nr:biosynthetic peptidoglycan transglycosylase [Candidatus Acidoferrum sp.]